MKKNIKIFLDLDGTLARFNVPNALNRFKTEPNFFRNLKAYKGIEIIDRMAQTQDLYIISASPHFQADWDKLVWIKMYLPHIKNKNIVICRLGENKAEVIKKQLGINIDNSCILLDDYTRNLEQWQEYGGTGIKRLTSVADNSTKKWKGRTLKHLKDLNIAVELATM